MEREQDNTAASALVMILVSETLIAQVARIHDLVNTLDNARVLTNRYPDAGFNAVAMDRIVKDAATLLCSLCDTIIDFATKDAEAGVLEAQAAIASANSYKNHVVSAAGLSNGH